MKKGPDGGILRTEENGSQSLLYPCGHWSSNLELYGLEVAGPSSWGWPLLDFTTLPEEGLRMVDGHECLLSEKL